MMILIVGRGDEFTMPIWTALLAVSFLGEAPKVARITVAIVLGLVGGRHRPPVHRPRLDPASWSRQVAAVEAAISATMVKLPPTRSGERGRDHLLDADRPARRTWPVPAAIVWRPLLPAVLP